MKSIAIVLAAVLLAAPFGPTQEGATSSAEKTFRALEAEMLGRLKRRLEEAGPNVDAREKAHLEQGRDLVHHWQAFLREHGDSAWAFRAKNYLAQGLLMLREAGAAESLLREMERDARAAEEIRMVAEGMRHLRDDPEAGNRVLERFIAREKDPEKKAAAMLEKWYFVSAQRRSQRKALRIEISRQVAQLYPDTAAGRKAALQVRAAELGPGEPALELREFRDTEGEPIALEAYRGKVLLIDFWAAWCGPCLRDLPDLKKAYEAFHARGFEILSVSLDTDRARWLATVKDRGMTWRHHFDGRGWGNEVAVRYLVDTLPLAVLVDRDGKVAAMNPRGSALFEAVRDLVEK